jgi:hypothetical protein
VCTPLVAAKRKEQKENMPKNALKTEKRGFAGEFTSKN